MEKEEKIISEVIIKIVEEITQETAGLEEDFIQSGLVDSMAFVEIIVKIEKEMDIVIPDEKLNMNELNTIKKLVDLVIDCKRNYI